MAPETTNGRPLLPQETAASQTDPDAAKRSKVQPIISHEDGHSRARAVVGPPIGRRRLWAVAVTRCPSCHGMHLHRAGDVHALMTRRVERGCPVTGELYTVEVTRVAGGRS